MTDLQTTARPRRPRPKMVTLTEAAAERVREIMATAEKPYVGLRVGVKNGGCAGQEYTFAYAEEIGPLDEVVTDKGATIRTEGAEAGFPARLRSPTWRANRTSLTHGLCQTTCWTVRTGLPFTVTTSRPQSGLP